MEGHMRMTPLRPMQPGDQARADMIVASAHKFMEGYTDYKKALSAGYTIFMPEVPQPVYHFTLNSSARDAERYFDPNRPTSLLYEKTTGEKPGFKLVGVMYTAPFHATQAELDQRIPLSVAQWHLHTNLCMPPSSRELLNKGADAKFGLDGSITTAPECKAAGGIFIPRIFGWMVHVYAFETDPAKIWSAGMDDEHGMQHGAMVPGMKM
jgi:hypothetical protein